MDTQNAICQPEMTESNVHVSQPSWMKEQVVFLRKHTVSASKITAYYSRKTVFCQPFFANFVNFTRVLQKPSMFLQPQFPKKIVLRVRVLGP